MTSLSRTYTLTPAVKALVAEPVVKALVALIKGHGNFLPLLSGCVLKRAKRP